MPEMCSECNASPIVIRKWRLCDSCYRKLRREGRLYSTPIAEIERRKWSFAAQHLGPGWIHTPAKFRLPSGGVYVPEFWDATRQSFIEIVDPEKPKSLTKTCREFHMIYLTVPLTLVDYDNQEIPWEGLE